MNTKHTPGPWRVAASKFREACRQKVCVVTDTVTVADCGIFLEERWDNAHLIAAAPELLEACKLALSALSKEGNEPGLVADTIREAIAKAEGKQ